jgi:hypothetical protein
MGANPQSSVSTLSSSENRLAAQQRARAHFEPQLIERGLADEQIATQSLAELRESLKRVDEALEHPETFTFPGVKFGSWSFRRPR